MNLNLKVAVSQDVLVDLHKEEWLLSNQCPTKSQSTPIYKRVETAHKKKQKKILFRLGSDWLFSTSKEPKTETDEIDGLENLPIASDVFLSG